MEQQFGKWECPIDLPIGAPLEDMPQTTIDQVNRQREAQEQHKRRMEEMEFALTELDKIAGDAGRTYVNTIRTHALPKTKSAGKCQNSGKQVGEVDQECCGGKINKVAAYSCSLHIITTDKKCNQCNDFNKVSS
jgi:hypothetical protein